MLRLTTLIHKYTRSHNYFYLNSLVNYYKLKHVFLTIKKIGNIFFTFLKLEEKKILKKLLQITERSSKRVLQVLKNSKM